MLTHSTQITTQEQLRRTIDALTETTQLLERELAYQPKFRKTDYLASLQQHAAKLLQMINNYKN